MTEPASNSGPLEGLNVRPANCILNWLIAVHRIGRNEALALPEETIKTYVRNAIKTKLFGYRPEQQIRHLGKKSFAEILQWLDMEAPKYNQRGKIISLMCPHCNKEIIL